MSNISEIWTVVEDDHGGEGTLPHVGLWASLEEAQAEIHQEWELVRCDDPDLPEVVFKDEHDHFTMEGRAHTERWTGEHADITYYFTQHLT